MSNILHPNTNEFNALIKEEGVVLVDFFATWCGPCKMLAPELEKLADAMKDKAKVVKIDVDQEQALAQTYKIMSVPTLLVFKNGELVDQKSGFAPYPALEQLLTKQL